MPTILLTGGSGFVGKNFFDFLAADGFEVISISRSVQEPRAGVTTLRIDESLEDNLRRLVEQAEVRHFVHLAGRINGSPAQLEEGNEALTRRLSAALLPFAKTLRPIFLSSVSAAGPLGSYGQSKRRAEEILQAAGFSRWIILRSSLIYGKYDTKNVGQLTRWIRRMPVVPVLGGRASTVQPLFVGDLYAAVKHCLLHEEPAKGTFTVAGPRQERLWDMVGTIAERLGKRVVRVPIPLGPVRVAASCLHALAPSLPLPLQQIRGMHAHAPWDFSSAQRAFGFSPRSFAEGIREIL